LLARDLAIVLKRWREQYMDDDGNDAVNGWIFGSIPHWHPFWRGTLQQEYLVPASERVGIQNLGWHASTTYRQ
jgi:hypothetical protein